MGNENENDTGHRDRRGVADCAHVDQRVIHSVLPARAFPGAWLSATDMEREASLRRVGVDGEYVPTDAICSSRKRLEPDPHGAAADLRVALVDPGAVCVGHLGAAESRFETLG